MFPWLTLMPLGEKGKYKFSSNRDKSETVVASGPQMASIKAGWPDKNGLLYLQSTGKEQYKPRALIDNSNQAVGCSIMTTDKTSVNMINTRRCRLRQWTKTEEGFIHEEPLSAIYSEKIGLRAAVVKVRVWVMEPDLAPSHHRRAKAANALTGSIKSWEAQQLIAQAPFLGLCIRSDMLIWPCQQAESPQLDNIEMSLAILNHHVLDTLKTLDLHAVVRLGATSQPVPAT
ncbi:hypothetical protein QBC37DRAFT_452636 [Rhypophila decipiens]|uniref:Uncharacterized protein n=1 Tax=Rhypophila decipiens TaxID=261697 RepID=A0AAN7BFS6_9PEZI|nr:hypothetical protein QBC37DRAFT_452636 [Rhypophila decipiens]